MNAMLALVEIILSNTAFFNTEQYPESVWNSYTYIFKILKQIIKSDPICVFCPPPPPSTWVGEVVEADVNGWPLGQVGHQLLLWPQVGDLLVEAGRGDGQGHYAVLALGGRGTIGLSRTLGLLLCQTVTLSHCHTLTLSNCCNFTLSTFYNLTLVYPDNIKL